MSKCFASVERFGINSCDALLFQPHPDQASLCLQAGNMQWFHVKHLDVGRQRCDLVGRVFALHRKPGAARGQMRAAHRNQVSQ